MHELRIERSVNAHGLFDLMRCKIRSVNSSLRAARALNDPYQSDELKLYSSEHKSPLRFARIERTEFAFNGSLQCRCIGHGWREGVNQAKKTERLNFAYGSTYILSVVLAYSCYDQYSLSSKDYKLRAFYRKV